MREIKFRACIPTLGKMCFRGKGLTLNEIRRLDESYFREDVLWLQCTGLKDKNGSEAYHNDLCMDGFNNIWRIDWSIEYAGFELTLIKAGDKMFGEIDKLNICRVIDSEVIGNINENPELLEVK